MLGATWEQAAEVAGLSDGPNAHRAVTRAFGGVPQPDREELRTLWRDRLESLWRVSVQDAHDRRPGAVTAGVRVTQAAAALDGLNAPVEVVVTPSTAEIEAFVARLVPQPAVVEYDIIGGEPAPPQE